MTSFQWRYRYYFTEKRDQTNVTRFFHFSPLPSPPPIKISCYASAVLIKPCKFGKYPTKNINELTVELFFCKNYKTQFHFQVLKLLYINHIIMHNLCNFTQHNQVLQFCVVITKYILCFLDLKRRTSHEI